MILGCVCARAGSRGLPGKNLVDVGGWTLLERAIAKAVGSDHIDVVYVSTDIDYTELQIQVAERGSVKPIIWQDRPSHLAGDKITKWPVLQAITLNAEQVFDPVSIVVDIDVSRPLTTIADIDETIRAYMRSEAPVMLAVSRAKKNPWQDTYVPDVEGWLHPALEGGASCRQDQPPAYEHGGIMCVDRDALLDSDDMWDEIVDGYEIARAHTFDIDDALDWAIVRAVHAEGAVV